MANLSHIRSKAQLIGTLNPKAWDALKPHTPFVFSNAHVELMVADAVKLVAGAITDKGLAREQHYTSFNKRVEQPEQPEREKTPWGWM